MTLPFEIAAGCLGVLMFLANHAAASFGITRTDSPMYDTINIFAAIIMGVGAMSGSNLLIDLLAGGLLLTSFAALVVKTYSRSQQLRRQVQVIGPVKGSEDKGESV